MDMFGELLEPIIESTAFQTASLALGLLTFAMAVAMVFWIYRDARRRGFVSILWGVLAAIALIAGVFVGFTQTSWGFIAVGGASSILVLVVMVIYTIVRPAEFAADAQERELSHRLLESELEIHSCPSCGAGIEVDYQICPSCNVTLRTPCNYCARPIKTGWSTCPYCLARKGQTDTPPVGSPAAKRSGRATTKAKVSSSSSERSTDSDNTESSGSSRSGRRSTGSGRASSVSAGSGSGRNVSRSNSQRSSADSDRELDFDKASTGSARPTGSARSSRPARTSTGSSRPSASATFKD